MIEKVYDKPVASEIVCLLKALADVKSGLATIEEASKMYCVQPHDLSTLFHETAEHEEWLNSTHEEVLQ